MRSASLARLLVGLVVSLAAVSGTGPVAGQATEQCFPETGFCIQGVFQAYWETHGALPIYGFPITGEMSEVDAEGIARTVQWFERARFEHHAEFAGTENDVLLGHLGREELNARYPSRTPGQTAVPERCFSETDKCIGGGFLKYWEATGGLRQHGLPLTNEFQGKGSDERNHVVQYFERARFELHEELAGTEHVVQLGLLGRERYQARRDSQPTPAQSPPSRPPQPSSPTPPPALPRLVLSPDYLDPKATMVRVFIERGVNPYSSYFARRAIEQWAPWMQSIYHVYWATEGDFNPDTRQFIDFVRHWAGDGLNGARFQRQMAIAVTQPTSLIGRRMRNIERGLDPDWRPTELVAGPQTYWTFLYGPYYFTIKGSTDRNRDVCVRAYDRQAMDYRVALLQNPSMPSDFGAWLARWRNTSCNVIT